MNDELNMAGNRIPFFMLVLTVFFRGSIFIFLNASILHHYIKGTSYSIFGELVDQGIFVPWKTILSTNTSLSMVSFLVLIRSHLKKNYTHSRGCAGAVTI